MAETFAKQIISARFKVVNNRRSRETANDRKPPPAPLVDQKTQEDNARLALLEALEKFAEPVGDIDNPKAITLFTPIPPLPLLLNLETVKPHSSARQSPRAVKSPSPGSKDVTGEALARENYQLSQAEIKRSLRQASVLRRLLSSVTAVCETVIYVFLRILFWPVDRFFALDRRRKGALVFISLVGLAVLSLPAPVEQLSDTQLKHSANPVATPNSTPRKKVNVNGSKNQKSRKKKPSTTRDPEF